MSCGLGISESSQIPYLPQPSQEEICDPPSDRILDRLVESSSGEHPSFTLDWRYPCKGNRYNSAVRDRVVGQRRTEEGAACVAGRVGGQEAAARAVAGPVGPPEAGAGGGHQAAGRGGGRAAPVEDEDAGPRTGGACEDG